MLHSAPKGNTLNVNVEYFDTTTNQYITITKSAKLTFVNSKNETLGKKDPRVSRSLLILNTQDVLKDIVPVIREHRYYRAVAMLTEQRIKLERFGSREKDKELLRDAQILNRYSDKLYNFDETVFQTLKIRDDLSWDSERYTESFN